jgi:hypothetical protein
MSKSSVIELAGPGGAGKSTLLSNIAALAEVPVLAVSPTKSAGALLSGMRSALRLSATHRLTPREWLSLSRNCAAVEHAIAETRDLQGLWVVDEGPLRCLRERRCHDGAELRAWREYARSVVARVATPGETRMVIFDVDQSVREERWRARTQREDAMRKAGFQIRSRIGLFLDERLGFRVAPAYLGEELDAMLIDAGARLETFNAGAAESPQDIARRFLREVIERQMPAQSSAQHKGSSESSQTALRLAADRG